MCVVTAHWVLAYVLWLIIYKKTLYTCFCAIHLSSLVKCLSMSFVHYLNRFFLNAEF